MKVHDPNLNDCEKMKYKIDNSGNTVKISVTDIKGKSQKVLKAFQDCKEGNCSCKTTEYEKVESFEVKQNGSDVELIIKTKDQEVIDSSEIENCLAHTNANLTE